MPESGTQISAEPHLIRGNKTEALVQIAAFVRSMEDKAVETLFS